MNNDQKFWLWVLTIVMLGLIGIASVITGGICLNNYVGISAGYEKVSLPGQVGTYWQKVKVEK